MRNREDIDQEYTATCTRYGHLAQEKENLRKQKVQILNQIEEHRQTVEAQFESEIVKIDLELKKIKDRWQELKVEVQSLIPQSE